MDKEKQEQLQEVEKKQEETQEQEQEQKVYTQEEVDKLLQSESDKRVTEALKKAESKFSAELEQKLKEEAELAKMTEEEKHEAKLQAEMEQFEAERAQFLKEKNELFATKQLNEQGLPITFSSYVLADDEEVMVENIEKLKEVWQEAIEAEVNSKLAGKTPKTHNKTTTTMTVQEFKALNYYEREKLLVENPELYQSMKAKL